MGLVERFDCHISDGRVQALRPGSVEITATAGGQTGSVVLLVYAPVATITLSPDPPSIESGQSLQLTATLHDADGVELTARILVWSISDPTVATISAIGLVTAVAYASDSTRTAIVTATSEGQSGSATLTVTPATVATVELSDVTMMAGRTAQMVAVPKDAAGRTLVGRTAA